ncbi:unnamed protein product (macronuclear) [Paramecium tetraurelia]|uniref:Uncharacterized protein n=1 Tax=Paramecium tetraurelia TaxID=5888 RepID=A0C7P6_PARTE|nr:uncharacterized protein GSPATT00035943001 [Paramecium tetraurelia]CAK66813.1 unnamed protein product [Paramecium tetraurelia]|eukprot:XP_001434210.1 hypothetical protein (macronuclear) [Paramecium tetraurelia strain d4-2]
MIDDKSKVWLIETNTNPCLECLGPLLPKLIPQLIEDLFKLILDPLYPPPQFFTLKSLYMINLKINLNQYLIRQCWMYHKYSLQTQQMSNDLFIIFNQSIKIIKKKSKYNNFIENCIKRQINNLMPNQKIILLYIEFIVYHNMQFETPSQLKYVIKSRLIIPLDLINQMHFLILSQYFRVVLVTQLKEAKRECLIFYYLEPFIVYNKSSFQNKNNMVSIKAMSYLQYVILNEESFTKRKMYQD